MILSAVWLFLGHLARPGNPGYSRSSSGAGMNSSSSSSSSPSSSSSSAAAAAAAECAAFTPIEALPAKLLLVCAHAATLAALCACAKTIYDKVEIAHPVFAVVFQEVLVLCATEAAAGAFLLAIVAGGGDGDGEGQSHAYLHFPFMGVSTMALQFHQISWLCITLMRSRDARANKKPLCILLMLVSSLSLLCLPGITCSSTSSRQTTWTCLS